MADFFPIWWEDRKEELSQPVFLLELMMISPPLETLPGEQGQILPFPDLAGEKNKGDERDRRERGKGGWFGEGQI